MPFNTPLLQLEPESALHFKKMPTYSKPNRMLKVSNLSSGNVAFKIKTTVPNAYFVKPTCGTLRPNGLQEVQVIRRPQAVFFQHDCSPLPCAGCARAKQRQGIP